MPKKLLVSTVILCAVLALIVVYTNSHSLTKPPLQINAKGSYAITDAHKLLGYYATYKISTTTCSAFVAPSGDVDFILFNNRRIHDQKILDEISHGGFTTFNIDIRGLPADQRRILTSSKDSEEWYVYLDVKDSGKDIFAEGADPCESFVKIVSVEPMVPSQFYGASTTPYIPVDLSEYVGVISTSTDGQHLFTSNKYKLQFEYPQGWTVGDNHLGYGTFQLFNYDQTIESGEFQRGATFNKIEAGVGGGARYEGTEEYPLDSKKTQTFKIANQSAIRELITFKYGAQALFYSVQLPNQPARYLEITMYGDPSNFSVLDQIMKTLRWIN